MRATPLLNSKPQALVADEKDVQRAILEYLHYRGYYCWRNNSGVMQKESFSKKTGDMKKYWVRFGHIGSGDILGLKKDGRFFSIEVKKIGGRLTEHQEMFANRIKESQGIAITAYSVDDVVEAGF